MNLGWKGPMPESHELEIDGEKMALFYLPKIGIEFILLSFVNGGNCIHVQSNLPKFAFIMQVFFSYHQWIISLLLDTLFGFIILPSSLDHDL